MSKIYFIFNHIKLTIGTKQVAQETEGVDFQTLFYSHTPMYPFRFHLT